MTRFSTLLSIASVALLLSCSKQDAQKPTTDTASATPATPAAAQVTSGQGRGLVIATKPETKTLTVAHNDIPGIMDAMTMDYPVENAALLTGISKGDSIAFTVKMPSAGEFMVTQISKIPTK